MVLYTRDIFCMLHVRVGEAWVAQWSERWTLGRTARVRVLDGALRCGLKQVASLTLLRLLG